LNWFGCATDEVFLAVMLHKRQSAITITKLERATDPSCSCCRYAELQTMEHSADNGAQCRQWSTVQTIKHITDNEMLC